MLPTWRTWRTRDIECSSTILRVEREGTFHIRRLLKSDEIITVVKYGASSSSTLLEPLQSEKVSLYVFGFVMETWRGRFILQLLSFNSWSMGKDEVSLLTVRSPKVILSITRHWREIMCEHAGKSNIQELRTKRLMVEKPGQPSLSQNTTSTIGQEYGKRNVNWTTRCSTIREDATDNHECISHTVGFLPTILTIHRRSDSTRGALKSFKTLVTKLTEATIGNLSVGMKDHKWRHLLDKMDVWPASFKGRKHKMREITWSGKRDNQGMVDGYWMQWPIRWL